MSLLVAMRAHLVADGVVRVPRVAGSAPPLWLQPRDGVPAPGEGNPTERDDDAVLGAFVTGGIPPRPYESMLRKTIVDLHIRTRTPSGAIELDAALAASLIDRRNWLMDDMRIVESLQWRALQPLGSDAQGFTFVVAYVFETYAA